MALEKSIYLQAPLKLEIFNQAENFALSDAHLLIVGESGTGKKVMAHLIHAQSARYSFPLVHLSCVALDEDLLDIELFGYEKKGRRGGNIQKKGKIEEAQKGILLLSEICTLPLKLQKKLSRALKTQEIYRVGGGSPLPIDIRIISTNHYFLENKVKQGCFREDLYCFLNKENLFLPPLRHRPQDIEFLSEYFLRKFSISLDKKKIPFLSVKAKNILKHQMWPDNIRELEQILYRLLSHLEKFYIDEEDLKEAGFSFAVFERNSKIKEEKNGLSYVGQTIAEVEKKLILKTLESCLGNRTKAAHLLGISIRTLRNKLHQYIPIGQNYKRSGTDIKIES